MGSIYIGNKKINKIFVGSTPIQKVYTGSTLIFAMGDPPVINSFTANPTNIDLDSRPSGNVRLSLDVGGPAINDAHVVLFPQGTRVGQTYVSTGNARIQQAFDTPQPNMNQIYRLIAHNNTGTAKSDALVQVTQNAAISNFRRTAFQQAPGLQAGTFWFEATIKGYPEPTLTYRFGNGRQGNITKRHLTTAAGVNTFSLDWNIYHTVLSDSLVLTATNSSNTTTSTISHISN